MKVTCALVLLSQAIAFVSGTRCNADSCLRQVTGDRYDGYQQNQRRADCTKYLVKTVYRGISTKWATKTTKRVTTKTIKKTVTKTVGKVTTKTVGKVVTITIPTVVTSYTTRTVRTTIGDVTTTIKPPVVTKRDLDDYELAKRDDLESYEVLEPRSGNYNYPSPRQPGTVANCVGWRYVQKGENCDDIVRRFSRTPWGLTKANLLKWNPALKNGSGLKQKHYVCIRINNMPSYISACDARRYTSACSCWGIKPGTKTSCSKTTTKTTTKTSISTCTKTYTSTKTKTTTGTVTKTSTSTKRVTSTSTKVIVSTKTITVPASTATVVSCPTGYIECDNTCINPLTNEDHCGKCGTKCSTYCQAGACAGCTATISICEDGGGHLCGDEEDESTCICTLNAEGQRACVVSSNCEGDICSKSSDCPSGWTCVPGTCCGDEPVCMRAPSGCPNGQNVKRIFKRDPEPIGIINKRRILVPEFDLSWKLARMK